MFCDLVLCCLTPRVKLGSNDLNCVDVPVDPTHSHSLCVVCVFLVMYM